MIFGAIASSAVIGCGGAVWLSITPNNENLSIDFALKKIDGFIYTKPDTTGDWDLYQILIHCAQSVEYSMTGYPEHKPELFKETVGRLAFLAFSSKGKMTHELNEPIPGAAMISQGNNIEFAYARLKDSLLTFKNFQGKLSPHFAYGELTKSEYERAHVMHINNHLLEVDLKVT